MSSYGGPFGLNSRANQLGRARAPALQRDLIYISTVEMRKSSSSQCNLEGEISPPSTGGDYSLLALNLRYATEPVRHQLRGLPNVQQKRILCWVRERRRRSASGLREVKENGMNEAFMWQKQGERRESTCSNSLGLR